MASSFSLFLQRLLGRPRGGEPVRTTGSVTSFRETFRQRPRSGSAELLFAEIRDAFDPNSRLIQTWHQLVLLCILYELFILPYIAIFDAGPGTTTSSTSHSGSSTGHRRLSSDTSSPSSSASDAFAEAAATSVHRELLVLYACELVFLVDIYVRLNTGYYEDGNVLRDRGKSRLKYLKSWAFVLDVAALPPLALVLPTNAVAQSHRVLLEFHKLLRLRRLPSLISNLDDFYARYFVPLKLSKVLMTTLFVSHLVACGRFAFGYDTLHIDHWLPRAPTEDHSSQRRYLMSLFWAFGLLSGLFEGELPHTVMEFGFTIVVALCGFSLFTYLCATFFMLSKCEGGEAEMAEARVNQFKHLLAFHRVPEHMQRQAVGYLKRYYAQAEANDREASKLLCPSITVDIQIELLQETVSTIPVFKGCDSQFIKAVTSLLEMVAYPAQFVLFRSGDHGDAMYVIHSGVLNTIVNGTKVRELRKGSFFGEVAVFAHIPRSATMITATYCTLYRLSRFHADKLMEGYPRYAKLITESVDQMLKTTKPNDAPASLTTDAPAPTSKAVADRSRRKSTRASFMEAVGIKLGRPDRQDVAKRDGTAPKAIASGHSSRRGSPSPVPNDVGNREVVQAAAGARVVPAETVNVQPTTEENVAGAGAEGAKSDKVALREQRASRASVSRHLSWKEPGSSKVAPVAVFPGSPLLRRTSIAVALLASPPRETLINKSRSQLELLKSNLFRLGRGSIEAMKPDAMKGFYDQIQRLAAPKVNKNRWWSKLLLSKCVHAESPRRMVWLLVLQVVLCYNWIMTPLQLAFPLFDRPRWYIKVANLIVDIIVWIDLYVNLNLSFSINSETIFDTTRSAGRYFKSGHLLADLICAFPYEWVVSTALGNITAAATKWSIEHSALRLPRLLRVWRVRGHLREVEEYLVLKSKQRLMLFGVILVMLYHVVACVHFSITYWEGFSTSEEAWIPSDDIFLDEINVTTFADIHGAFLAADSDEVSIIQARQYFRSLYYATNVLAALGKTIEPGSDRQYAIALLLMLSGFLITAIVVDNVQKRFTASALEQKEFFATRARIQLFLKRQDAPLTIHQRVNSFLDYWWSSHRGAIIGELLDELPETIKRSIVRSICKSVIETLGMLFPQIWTEETGMQQHAIMATVRVQIEELFVDNLRFVLYGQGEVIYRQGDYPSGLYFLLEGQISVESGAEGPRRIPVGGYFGTASLNVRDTSDSDEAPHGHTEQVTAQSGCIIVFVSREHLGTMQTVFPGFADALRKSEYRLQIALRVKKAGEMESDVTKTIRPGTLQRSSISKNSFIHTIRSSRLWKIVVGDDCFDPDSTFIGLWEVWIFAAMTAQSTMTIYHICFGVVSGGEINPHKFVRADAVMVFLEICFLLDVLIRMRLGFYEFGNKVMSLRQIKAHYIGSKYFMIDIFAVLPFFVVSWTGHSVVGTKSKRVELLNANKLLRLLKSSSQFRALEAKHVKLTMELRLIRLVYYTFLASHTFGCIWFDFAAHNSGIHPLGAPSFGDYKWLPSEYVEVGSRSLQYFGSVFWSFGLMTASNTGELPKTVSQCLFSVVTMTVGFFLFAYVVGNFLDVIELQDSENRHFIAKLSSLRHLLEHFKLPQGIEGKFKTYFFFKRFHSITQEHVLERVLPPSLLVDIRMFQLQPMIVKVAFLAGMEDSVTRMLVSLFTQILVVKDMYICKFGEEGKEMFFIFTGVLDIYIPLPPGVAPTGSTTSTNEGSKLLAPNLGNQVDDTSGMLKVNQITAGSYFGEAALFTKAPRNAYVKARTSCILYRLSRESLELVFERFPEWKEKVLRIVKIQQDQQRLMRLAAEAQEPDSSGAADGAGRRRSLKRSMSRLDIINSRAQDMEELVLANTRGGRGSRFSPLEWLMKKLKALSFVKWARSILRKLRRWVRHLVYGTEVQSSFYLFWLRLVTFSTVYVALIAPYRCAYDDLDRWTPFPVMARVVECLCEIVFWWDIWFHFRVHDSLNAMELYEQDHLQAYKRERLLWDLIAAFPLELFVVDQFFGTQRAAVKKWFRLNRCIKVANLVHYRLEVNRRSVIYELNRLVTLSLLYLLMMYWTSCAYFAVAMHEGFSIDWQAWLPSEALYNTDDTSILMLRLMRGFLFAVTAFVKKGKTFVPTQTLNFGFSVVVSFVGQLIMALMIGEVASIFILYIDNEVVFRKNHISVELFLSRKRISPELKLRCNAFLTSWWSSHAGVDYQLIFDDLPPTVRTEGIMFIAQKPLNKLMDRVFRPLTRHSGNGASSYEEEDDNISLNADVAVENLMHSIAQHLRFEGYPRGEDVVVEGTVCRAVFFVVRGYLYSKSSSNAALYHAMRYRTGDYFGEKGLLGHSVSLLTVSTIRACDLFVLRSEHLIEAIKSHWYFSVLYRMAQDIVRLKKSPEDYFTDVINKDRRDVLRRRLSAPLLSSSPTPMLLRANTKSRQSMRPLEDSPMLQRVLQQSSQLEWEEAFRQFMEMLVPRGSLNGVSGAADHDSDEGKDQNEPKEQLRKSSLLLTGSTAPVRTKRAKSQYVSPSSQFSGMSGVSGSPPPAADAAQKRRVTSPAFDTTAPSTPLASGTHMPTLAEISSLRSVVDTSPTIERLQAALEERPADDGGERDQMTHIVAEVCQNVT